MVLGRPAFSSSLRSLRGSGALILGDHRQSLAVARSLWRAGYGVIAARNGRRTILERSRCVAEVWDQPSPLEPTAWTDALEAFCARREDVGVVFPIGEREIELAVPLVGKLPALVAIVPPAILAVCRSKRALLDLAKEANVPTQPWEAVDEPGTLEPALRRVGFPAVLKPNSYAEGMLGFKAMIVSSENAVRQLLAERTFPDCGFVVQRFAHGVRHNIYFVACAGRLLGHVEVKILRTNRLDDTGLAVEGESVPPSPALLAWTEALVERLAYTGAGCAQFIVDATNKTSSFLEINARLAANCAAACACGLDLPRLFIESCIGVAEPQPPAQVGRRYAWLHGDLNGLLYSLANAQMMWTDVPAWLARLVLAQLRAHDHITWSWRDPLPTFAVYSRFLRDLFGSARRHTLGPLAHPSLRSLAADRPQSSAETRAEVDRPLELEPRNGGSGQDERAVRDEGADGPGSSRTRKARSAHRPFFAIRNRR